MPEQVPMTIGRSKIGARFRESEADTHTKSERLDRPERFLHGWLRSMDTNESDGRG